GCEYPTPAPVICNPADPAAGNRRADSVAKESGEAGSGAGRLLRPTIERTQTDDHDRPVDQKANGDQGRVVDPQRSLAVEPVDEHRDQSEGHEQDRRRGSPPLEPAFRNPST